jgi:hypothetical protein
MAGLKDLLGSLCNKRRIRSSAIRDYQMGEHKNPSHPFNVTPTYRQGRDDLKVDDYRKKPTKKAEPT